MWPSAKWFMIMLTWMAPLPPEPGVEATPIMIPLKRQEIPRHNLKHCESTIARLKRGWITADDTYEQYSFGYALDCQLNPNYKPKGKRK